MENGGSNGLHHKVPMPVQNMYAVAVEVVLANEYGGELYPEFVGEVV